MMYDVRRWRNLGLSVFSLVREGDTKSVTHVTNKVIVFELWTRDDKCAPMEADACMLLINQHAAYTSLFKKIVFLRYNSFCKTTALSQYLESIQNRNCWGGKFYLL